MHQFIPSDANNKKFDDLVLIELISDKDIQKLYTKNNITRELVELFNEFSLNLIVLLHDTYLGKHYIKREEDIIAHFKWCFLKICDNYKKLNIDFYDNQELYEWFFKHSFTHIYKNKEYKIEKDLEYDLLLFNSIMIYDSKKGQPQLTLMIELYNIMKKSIK